MILNTITLHNFMSYGDATLDLTSFSMACLSGFNGAGKSAVLDAITWAVWESARSSSDEMIRAGQQEMWVDVTFELEGATYRVRRSRQRSAPRAGARTVSKGTLDFQVLTGRNPRTWKSLTAASMRETQARICELLRMDYDTFINSVYLRQGRADEFTTRPPSERKQLLSEILGLSYFDKLQELAKDRCRQSKAQIDILQSAINQKGNLHEVIAAGKLTLTHLAEQIAESTTTKQQKSAELRRVQVSLNELMSLETRMEPTMQRLAELEQDVDALKQTETQLSARNEELISLLVNQDEIEQAAERFKEVRQQVERLDAAALERQDLETKKLHLKTIIATSRGRLEVELEHLKERLVSLQSTSDKLAKNLPAKEKIETAYQAYRQLLKTESELAKKQEDHTRLSARAEHLHTMVVEARLYLEVQQDQKGQSLSEVRSLIAGKETMDSERAQLDEESAELDRLEVEFEVVEEQGIKCKQEIDAIDSQMHQLHHQISQNNQKADELNQAQSLTMCPLCTAPIVDKVAVIEKYSNLNREIDSQIIDLEGKKSVVEEKRATLRQRYSRLKQKLDARKQLDVRIGDFNARLAALTRADEMLARLSDEIALIKERLQNNRYAEVERESLVSIKGEIHKLEFDPITYSSIQAQIRADRHVEARYIQLQRDEQELNAMQKSIPELNDKIEQYTDQLANDAFACTEREDLKVLNEKLALIPYDRTEHQRLKQELSQLLRSVELFKSIERAASEQPQVQLELSTCQERLQVKLQQQTQLIESVKLWSEQLEGKEKLEQLQLGMIETIAEIDASLQSMDRQLIVAQAQDQQLQQEALDLETKTRELDEQLIEMNDYGVLADAFGKKGIQAVIIENAVPEIEAEANNILAKLSDNQMHIALVTQQRTKQGNISETLEILIADQLGTRSYELYSGGEAFKINFAIRLALSRLLAHRAGAKLQTLIIDEGFGSQDEISRDRFVRAIEAIKSDFERILIVTHITEIKDLFPVQIQVQKTDGMSNLCLLHAM